MLIPWRTALSDMLSSTSATKRTPSKCRSRTGRPTSSTLRAAASNRSRCEMRRFNGSKTTLTNCPPIETRYYLRCRGRPES